MFGWISDRLAANETNSALGSARTARALVARLETETPQYALDEIAKQFHAAPRDVLGTPNGSRALQLLDEWAQAHLAQLWGSLLGDSLGQTVKEVAWSTLARYYRRCFLAHWNSLGLTSGSEKMPDNASTLAARGMAAFCRYMLLQRMRYLPVADESWTPVWRLMAWVEQQKAAATPAPLYARGPATTIQREFLIALMIEVAPTGNLLPGQMLALDHLLRAHAEHYRTADRYDPQSTPFSYEPGRNVPPQRYLEGLKLHGGLRFFGPGAAHAEFRKARDDAHDFRNLPQWLAQTHCSADGYAELLDRLVAQWSPEPPRRRHRRETCTGEILVAHDLPTIRRLVKFSELALAGQSLGYDSGNIYTSKNSVPTVHADGRSGHAVTAKAALANLLTFEKSLDPGSTETWQLSDSSESGIGAHVAPDCAWAKVGMVIAFRPRESVDWQVAMIRRLSRATNGPLSIGMARLGGKVRSARLRRGIGAVDYAKAGSEIEYDAIAYKEATSSLILPVGVFDRTQKYTLTCEDRQQVVKMEKSLERRPNFECVEISEVELLRAA